MDLNLSGCQSPLGDLENQTSLLLYWHPPREQSGVDMTRGEHSMTKEHLEKTRTEQQGQAKIVMLSLASSVYPDSITLLFIFI